MREVIYLAASKYGVRGMWKNMPSLQRGEIPIKISLEIEERAFREPSIQQEIIITDWREGIDIPDADIHELVITQEEAEIIKARRLEAMVGILKAKGYDILPPDTQEQAADEDEFATENDQDTVG
jgi:hypothetical protein